MLLFVLTYDNVNANYYTYVNISCYVSAILYTTIIYAIIYAKAYLIACCTIVRAVICYSRCEGILLLLYDIVNCITY